MKIHRIYLNVTKKTKCFKLEKDTGVEERNSMMYEYMTLSDNTTIAHSDMKKDGKVKVYIEKPVEGGFWHVTCFLPKYEWVENEGFSDDEIVELKKFVENNAHIIMEFSQKGGFENASSF